MTSYAVDFLYQDTDAKELFFSRLLRTPGNIEWYRIIREDHCGFCGQKKSQTKMTWEHIQPRSRGGENRWHNLARACSDCNTSKASYSLLEFMLHMGNPEQLTRTQRRRRQRMRAAERKLSGIPSA